MCIKLRVELNIDIIKLWILRYTRNLGLGRLGDRAILSRARMSVHLAIMLHMPWRDSRASPCYHMLFSIAMSSEYVHLSYAATACNYHVCLPAFQLCSCICLMGIDHPSEDLHLSYAAIACDYHFCVPVVQLCSCMFLSCHLTSIPFLIW